MTSLLVLTKLSLLVLTLLSVSESVSESVSDMLSGRSVVVSETGENLAAGELVSVVEGLENDDPMSSGQIRENGVFLRDS